MRFLYKRYSLGKTNIIFYVEPDHLADCIDIGHVRKIEFKSGNSYKARFLESIPSKHRGLYIGKYEISKDIQELSFDEFTLIVRGTKFNFKRADKGGQPCRKN